VTTPFVSSRGARLAIVVIAATAIGCAPALVPPPPEVQAITVLPPNNRTGDGLLIAGASLLEWAFAAPRVTVADVLADETETLLRARGYPVQRRAQAATGAPPESSAAAAALARRTDLAGAALYLEIRRWEPDVETHPAFVIVGVEATLIDAATGQVVWSLRPRVHPVPTPGAVTLGTAYEIAARKVAAEVLASWMPARR